MELKSIDSTTRGKARLHDALSIYRETILPEAQNPERQILYWIDHSRDNLTDEFRCFAVQNGRETVGYLQYSYFREEHIFFFEYLCLLGAKHSGLAPTEAITTIEDFLNQNYLPHFTIVFEVAYKKSGAGEWKNDKKLVDYFKRLGFRVIDFGYRYPVLQSYEGELSYPADLMVRLPNNRKEISQSELRTVLRCIYFKHYLRWDRPFLDPARFGERERLINELYSAQAIKIGESDTFGTSGDDRRTRKERSNFKPPIRSLFDNVFGPKLPRLITVSILLLWAQRTLGNPWLLLPFVLAVAAVYCLAEDTDASRKLFLVVISRFRSARPRSS